MPKANVRRVKDVYPSLDPLSRAVRPIPERTNDPEFNPVPVGMNTAQILKDQERLNRKHESKRLTDDEPRGAGTFEPSGPNTKFRNPGDATQAL